MKYRDKIKFLTLRELDSTMCYVSHHLNIASTVNMLLCSCYWVFKGTLVSYISIGASIVLICYIVVKIIQFFMLKKEFDHLYTRIQEIRKTLTDKAKNEML